MDEQGIIAIMKAVAGNPGIGDDVSSLPSGKGKLVVKTDMLVGKTDVPRGMTHRQAARKAVAACVSDFAAKGVMPTSFLVSLGIPRGTSKREIRELAEGFRTAEKEWGLILAGGDTNEASDLVIDCSMFGFSRNVVGRAGASPGDLLVVTGAFGLPPAGLRILEGTAKARPGFRGRAVRSVLEPSPSLAVGAALARFLTSSMDSSDGLARSIHSLATASGVGFEVNDLPAANGVGGFARDNSLDRDDLVLRGGEEYVIVGTLPPTRARRAEKAVEKAGGRLLLIGKATRRRSVVYVSAGARRPIEDSGWTHLSGS